MFWSVIADVSAQKSASGVPFSKIAYGSLVFGGQVGGIIGSLTAVITSGIGTTTSTPGHATGAAPILVFLQAIALFVVPLFMVQGFRRAMRVQAAMAVADSSADDVEHVVEPAPAPAGGCAEGCKNFRSQLYLLVEGLQLILSHPVLLGIFWVAAAHLIPRGILDYQGTGVVKWKWPAHHGDTSAAAIRNKNNQIMLTLAC
jgi:hypothetical protein